MSNVFKLLIAAIPAASATACSDTTSTLADFRSGACLCATSTVFEITAAQYAAGLVNGLTIDHTKVKGKCSAILAAACPSNINGGLQCTPTSGGTATSYYYLATATKSEYSKYTLTTAYDNTTPLTAYNAAGTLAAGTQSDCTWSSGTIAAVAHSTKMFTGQCLPITAGTNAGSYKVSLISHYYGSNPPCAPLAGELRCLPYSSATSQFSFVALSVIAVFAIALNF